MADDTNRDDDTLEDDEENDDSSTDDQDADSEDDSDEDADGGEGNDSDDSDDSDDDGDKPITKKDLKSILEPFGKKLSVLERHSKKNSRQGKNYTPPDKKKVEEDNGLRNRVDTIEQMERKRQFGYENDLTPKEVDLVFKFDRKPTAKTLNHPFVKGGLKELRARDSVNKNLPSGASARKFGTENKPFEALKPEEKSAHFKDRQRDILARRGKR